MFKLTLLLFSFFYTYAAVRYHVGKGIEPSDWLFVLNKSFAWLSFTLITLSLLNSKQLQKIQTTRKQLGNAGFLVASVHVCVTLLLFSEEHYPNFYRSGSINGNGWLIISIGVVSMSLYALLFWVSVFGKNVNPKVFQLGKVAVLVNVFHPILIGLRGWFNPQNWPLYMPPITMLAVGFVVVVFLLRKKGNSKPLGSPVK